MAQSNMPVAQGDSFDIFEPDTRGFDPSSVAPQKRVRADTSSQEQHNMTGQQNAEAVASASSVSAQPAAEVPSIDHVVAEQPAAVALTEKGTATETSGPKAAATLTNNTEAANKDMHAVESVKGTTIAEATPVSTSTQNDLAAKQNVSEAIENAAPRTSEPTASSSTSTPLTTNTTEGAQLAQAAPSSTSQSTQPNQPGTINQPASNAASALSQSARLGCALPPPGDSLKLIRNRFPRVDLFPNDTESQVIQRESNLRLLLHSIEDGVKSNFSWAQCRVDLKFVEISREIKQAERVAKEAAAKAEDDKRKRSKKVVKATNATDPRITADLSALSAVASADAVGQWRDTIDGRGESYRHATSGANAWKYMEREDTDGITNNDYEDYFPDVPRKTIYHSTGAQTRPDINPIIHEQIWGYKLSDDEATKIHRTIEYVRPPVFQYGEPFIKGEGDQRTSKTDTRDSGFQTMSYIICEANLLTAKAESEVIATKFDKLCAKKHHPIRVFAEPSKDKIVHSQQIAYVTAVDKRGNVKSFYKDDKVKNSVSFEPKLPNIIYEKIENNRATRDNYRAYGAPIASSSVPWDEQELQKIESYCSPQLPHPFGEDQLSRPYMGFAPGDDEDGAYSTDVMKDFGLPDLKRGHKISPRNPRAALNKPRVNIAGPRDTPTTVQKSTTPGHGRIMAQLPEKPRASSQAKIDQKPRQADKPRAPVPIQKALTAPTEPRTPVPASNATTTTIDQTGGKKRKLEQESTVDDRNDSASPDSCKRQKQTTEPPSYSTTPLFTPISLEANKATELSPQNLRKRKIDEPTGSAATADHPEAKRRRLPPAESTLRVIQPKRLPPTESTLRVIQPKPRTNSALGTKKPASASQASIQKRIMEMENTHSLTQAVPAPAHRESRHTGSVAIKSTQPPAGDSSIHVRKEAAQKSLVDTAVTPTPARRVPLPAPKHQQPRTAQESNQPPMRGSAASVPTQSVKTTAVADTKTHAQKVENGSEPPAVSAAPAPTPGNTAAPTSTPARTKAAWQLKRPDNNRPAVRYQPYNPANRNRRRN